MTLNDADTADTVEVLLVGGPHSGDTIDVPGSTRAVKLLEAGDDKKTLPPMAHFYTTHGGCARDGRDFTYQGCARGDSGGSYLAMVKPVPL